MTDAQEQFFEDLAAENRVAALLVAQVGGMPSELQLITQVADYDEAAGGLRPVRSYIIRVSGAEEHRVVNLGMTVADIKIYETHPLLAQYNDTPVALFFRGVPDDTNSIVLDIAQAHAMTFQGWREFPQYLNVEHPLETLFRSGGGLMGQMPQSLADALIPVLEKHGLEYKIIEGEQSKSVMNQRHKVLVMGQSYFVSYAFSFDEMRGRQS
ncbi:MAG: hypothetical protein ACPG7F_19095 [Aggregatilineales bacterium]